MSGFCFTLAKVFHSVTILKNELRRVKVYNLVIVFGEAHTMFLWSYMSEITIFVSQIVLSEQSQPYLIRPKYFIL